MKNRSIPLLVVLGCLAGGPVVFDRARAAEDDYEVLTRGPVHEAFAEAVSFEPEPGLIVNVAPPAAVEELPPEQRPEGDNVTWISGYWYWDDERKEFLWISGIWRNVPPDRQWVPGYWNDLRDGRWQWTSGYWAGTGGEEVEYVAQAPPRSIEAGPNVAAPSADYSWVPGVWTWWETRYVWRPGCWTLLRPNWTWVPARYCWTPRGYLFVDGYWDYAVGCRGVVFAPVCFRRPVWTHPGYFYTPSIVVALNVFNDHLFYRPRSCHYYFGDYYAASYRNAGFYASFTWHSQRCGYDPIYAHHRWDHRHERDWEHRHREGYEYLRRHEEARPPHTWADMRRLDARRDEGGRHRVFAGRLDEIVRKPVDGLRFAKLDAPGREQFVAQQRRMREFGQERQRIEARAAGGGEEARATASRAALQRSPIVGRRVSELAANEAPPARIESRGGRDGEAGVRPRPGAGGKPGAGGGAAELPRTARVDGREGERPEGTPPGGGTDVRESPPAGIAGNDRPGRTGRTDRTVRPDAGEVVPRAKPVEGTEGAGAADQGTAERREVQPVPSRRIESPRKPEIRREVPRTVEPPSQPEVQPAPSRRIESPRKPEIRREVPRAVQPPSRPEVQPAPSQRIESPRQPEIRREVPRAVQPPSRPQVQPAPSRRIESPRQPEIRREVPRTVQPPSRSQVQPAPSRRIESPRQPEVRAPQREAPPQGGGRGSSEDERGRGRGNR